MLKIDFDKVESIIREVAATEIMPRFRHLQSGDVSFKVGDDPVTIADKEAEKALTKALCALLPGSKVVGEEAFFENPGLLDLFSGDSPVWTVDPVDGTRNFVAGDKKFGVIVSLTQQNETIAGWHYNPHEDSFIAGEKGAGVFYKQKASQDRRLAILPPAPLKDMRGNLGEVIEIAHTKALREGRLPAESPYLSPCLWSICYEYAQMFLNGPDFGLTQTQWNYHGLHNFCSPWDNSAGVFFYTECGGYAAHWDSEPYKPSHYRKGLILAPDQKSWTEIKDWVSTFCELPA